MPITSDGKAPNLEPFLDRICETVAKTETGIAQDCVVELGGLEPAAERLWD
jgi:hypothetical protein